MTLVKFVLHLVKQTRQIMKAHLLFPRYFRLIGFLLAVPGLVLGYLFLFHRYTIPDFGPGQHPGNMLSRLDNYTNELALTLVVVGLIFIAFAKVKTEDELTAYIRLNSLYWAILIHYLVLIFLTIYGLLNGGELTDEVLGINLIMPLIIFILRFYYLLYKNRDEYYAPPGYFLPHKPFNKIGKMLSLICLLIFISYIIYSIIIGGHESNAWDYFSISVLILPLTLLIWVFSKEAKEDEFINTIRLTAMQTAIYVNYVILLVANLYFYLSDFLFVEYVNLSTIPLIFIIVFQYRLYRLSKQTDDKKSNSVNLSIL